MSAASDDQEVLRIISDFMNDSKMRSFQITARQEDCAIESSSIRTKSNSYLKIHIALLSYTFKQQQNKPDSKTHSIFFWSLLSASNQIYSTFS